MEKLLMKAAYRAVGFGINAVSFFDARKAGVRAFNVFCNPPKPVIRAKEMEFLNTAKQTQERTSEQNTPFVQYVWGSPDKPYVLCAYGWAYNAGRWRHFVPQLVEAGYRVIAFDPPGHGLCKGNHLNLLVNAGIVQSIIQKNGQPEGLIAHSFGGSSSMMALMKLDATLHPKRMVIMASFSNPLPIFMDFSSALGLRSIVFQRFVQHAESLLKRPIESVDLAKFSEQLGAIDALIVHDPKDTVTPFEHAERYAAHWPNAELLVADGAGHHLGTQDVTDRIVGQMTMINV
jgi:pimeloyl-ACP methyl ester carboxylesterase